MIFFQKADRVVKYRNLSYWYEAYVSAENPPPDSPPWLSEAHEYDGWAECDSESPPGRSEEVDHGIADRDMLSSAHRLQKGEVEEVFRKGKPFFVMDIGVRYMKNNQKITKIAFVCGKKVLNKASHRNRFKRLAREAARALQKKWPEEYTIVVFAAKTPKDMSLEGMKQALLKAFERIR